jgi:DNA-binding CsgD family transcriptional regulator
VPEARIFGREHELAGLGDFLSAQDPVLLLAGGPGIGKTTLWEAGVELARDRGFRVLATRPRDAETHLSLAGLSDLLEDVDLDELPVPQRRALAIATLRAAANGEPEPAPRAVAAGVLSALRALAAAGPLLVAVDDAQWLDRDSAMALGFAARRLEQVPFLLSTRGPAALEQAFEPARRRRLEVGPLTLAAIRHMLSAQLGLLLPRRVMRRVYDVTQGNPLFALELGRTLAERGAPEIGEELSMPASLDALLGARVDRLPAAQRRALLAVALGAGLTRRQLEAIAGEDAVQAALDAGLLVAGERVRPAHPLLSATAARHAAPAERRALHLELAGVTAGDRRGVLHLALAAERPDASLSARLAAVAAVAAARGSTIEAVELAAHALRLTAEDAAERPERVLALGEQLDAAGETDRLSELLTGELDALPPGEPRLRAHLLLAEGGHVQHADQHAAHLAAALAESGGEPALRAPVLARLAIHAAVQCAERIPQAEAFALEALVGAGPDAQHFALWARAWARVLRGLRVDDLLVRQHALAGPVERSVNRVAAVRHVWRGETAAARAALADLRDAADERGETFSYLVTGLHLCELELRAGSWAAASRVLDEWAESADFEHMRGLVYERCRALAAVGRGNAAEARRWAGEAIAAADANGLGWQRLESLRARGLASLLEPDLARAAADLRTVWRATEREGIEDPGAFPAAPDLVEALLELGEPEEARAVTARLRELAVAQEHPWGMVTARRCEAVIADDPVAADEIATAYAQLGLPFDAARTRLALGRTARRRRRWGAARALLEAAVTGFAGLGSAGWAEIARSELERVGGRRASQPGELTPAERRVSELAADGMTNKEIAQALFISVHTVEAHLTSSYAKLGVRSRAQLARAKD